MSDIYHLSSAIVDEQVENSPLLATYLGFPGYDHLWDDFSPDGHRAHADLLTDQLRRVEAVDPGDDRWSLIGTRVAKEFLSSRIGLYEAEEHLRDLNSFDSPLQWMRDIFDHMPTEGAAAWENIAGRLEGLPAAMDRYRATLEEGRKRGMAVAERQVVESSRQARNFAGDASPFVTLQTAPDLVEIGDEKLVSRVAEGVSTARSAYASMAEYLEERYLPSATQRDAVGRERYALLSHRYLGDTLDPHATYEWGWEEVARLRERMEGVADQILPGASLRQALHLLQTDPDRAVHSQEEFRDLMQERLEVALADLDGSHFDVPEQTRRVDVKMAPPGGPLGAYYVSPSEDFSRPGSVWWSKGNKRVIPLFDEVSTAYHEGFPGHHLQAGFQMTAGDRVTRFQKLLVWYSGSGEGWALYAEDLMEELGYLDKPDYVMGKLAAEMLRACRVVIDIGSHLELPIPKDQPFHPGEAWSFELGVQMLLDDAAQDMDTCMTEMNRYLGWPGQAIAYKVGQKVIRDMRARAQHDLGAAFDLKEFHAGLLTLGAPGLGVLREFGMPPTE